MNNRAKAEFAAIAYVLLPAASFVLIHDEVSGVYARWGLFAAHFLFMFLGSAYVLSRVERALDDRDGRSGGPRDK